MSINHRTNPQRRAEYQIAGNTGFVPKCSHCGYYRGSKEHKIKCSRRVKNETMCDKTSGL